jgi:hypothetical protein
VIGGMWTSTFLTLLVIPVVYTLFDTLAGALRGAPASRPVTPADEFEKIRPTRA